MYCDVDSRPAGADRATTTAGGARSTLVTDESTLSPDHSIDTDERTSPEGRPHTGAVDISDGRP